MIVHLIQNPADAAGLKPNDNFSINARIHKLKRSGKIVFVYLSCCGDIIKTVYKSGFCGKDNSQGIEPCELSADLLRKCSQKDISLLTEGMYIRAYGKARAEIKADNGIELRITGFEVLSSPTAEFPVSISDSEYNISLEETINNKPLTVRNPQIAAIYKIQSAILNSFSEFMERHYFIRLTTPVISAFSEKPSFEVDYFGKKVFLSHSPQLYMTAGTAAFDKVYAVSPSFLAKKYNSTRHLNEFTSLNFQQGYIESVEEIMSTASLCLRGIIENLRSAGHDLPESAVMSYTFSQAMEILGKKNQIDLDPTDIKKLCGHGSNKDAFVFVSGFPPDKRPFYAEDYNNFDIYYNGWKIAFGSKNICDYNVQLKKAERAGINLSDYKAYDDTLRYGIMPYGGCIIGLERLTSAVAGLDSVKAASLFTRDLHHIVP